MKSLIPLLILASAVAAVDVQKRVLNAVDCPASEGQHYVILHDTSSDYCGGNLLSQEWVLTAAHCNKEDFFVFVGFHAPISIDAEEMAITKTTERHFYTVNSHNHDIMLFKLPQKPTQTLPTITLPPVGCTSPSNFNEHYTIMGWSYTAVDKNNEKKKNKAVELQCGDVTLDQSYTGEQSFTTANRHYIKEHFLCSLEAGLCGPCPGNGPCESCPGDSGGSLVKKSDGVLYGVTVASHKTPKGLTLYMDVCFYRKWINDKTKI